MDPLLEIWFPPSVLFPEFKSTELIMNNQTRALESDKQEKQPSIQQKPRQRSMRSLQARDWGMRSRSNQFNRQTFDRFSQMQLFSELHRPQTPWFQSEMWLCPHRSMWSSRCCHDLTRIHHILISSVFKLSYNVFCILFYWKIWWTQKCWDYLF